MKYLGGNQTSVFSYKSFRKLLIRLILLGVLIQ